MDDALHAKVKKAGRYCRDVTTRKKINLFLEVIKIGNVRSVCRRHGVVVKTYYVWWNRFKKGGFRIEALQPKSRRPKRSPTKTKGRALKWIKYYRVEYHYGPERIQMYLKLNHDIDVAQSTIGEIIKREKLRLRRNRKKKVNKHTRRYSLPWPGMRLQMDIKYVPRKINGEQYYVFNAIDDCTRFRFSRLYRNKGRLQAVQFLRYIYESAPFKIQSIQLDNDMAFTYRLNPLCCDKLHPLESNATEMGIRLKFIPPGEKELQGKVERLHRIDDDEFFWKTPMTSFDNLQHHLTQWVNEYNHHRHHGSLDWNTPFEILTEKMTQIWAARLLPVLTLHALFDSNTGCLKSSPFS
jgi:transposase InsO family protein